MKLHSSQKSYEKHRLLENEGNRCPKCKDNLITHNGLCYGCSKGATT